MEDMDRTRMNRRLKVIGLSASLAVVLVCITSFNELAEHTHIEPTRESGWFYVDMTAKLVDEFKKKARERQSGPSIEELGSLRPVLDSTGFSGTVLVYDLKKDHWSAVGSEGADRRRIPASTYKIFNAMVALETGVVESDRTIIKWDGVTRSARSSIVISTSRRRSSFRLCRTSSGLPGRSALPACSTTSTWRATVIVTLRAAWISSGSREAFVSHLGSKSSFLSSCIGHSFHSPSAR